MRIAIILLAAGPLAAQLPIDPQLASEIAKIKAILPHFEAGLPKGVQLKILYDQSES